MTPCSLSQTIRTRALLGHVPIRLLDSTHSPLLSLVDQIYFCPLSWRKLMLDACRIQSPIYQNKTLLASFISLQPSYIPHPSSLESAILHKEDLAIFIDLCTSNSVTSSFLSYYVRSESTIYVKEFLHEFEVSLDKELAAAIHPPENPTGILDYSSLLTGEGNLNLHAELGYPLPRRLQNLTTNGIANIKSTLSSYTTLPLLPAYNARKNIAYESQHHFFELTSESQQMDVTTLDLLRFYAATGETIDGPLEMRQSWKFGDLKPRTYYCVGGTAYFQSLYIQDIANMFVKILPSTHPSTRFDVSRLNPVSPHDVLVTYDYSSFTTSLEELQSFLFWLGISLRGCPVEVLDVRTGIRTLDLGEYILAYNATVNVNQVFTVERLDSLIGVLRQNRSGSLGVKGNIVWSMFLHGLSLGSITGTPDNDCCVGDDALTAILATVFSMFVLCTNHLGEINQDKYTAIPRPSLDDPTAMTYHQFKFLKRPMRLTCTGEVYLGILDFFPSCAEIFFPNGDGIHTIQPCSVLARAKTFAMQCGRFFSLQLAELQESCSEGDLDFLLGTITLCYEKLGLPVDGAVPGFRIGSGQLDVFVPCVDKDVFSIHWMELLLIRYRGTVYPSPIRLDGVIPIPFDVVDGDRFKTTVTPFLRLLEDLGCVSTELIIEDKIFDDEQLDLELSRMAGLDEGSSLYVDVVCLNLPSWYFEYAIRFSSELCIKDPEEALSVVTSLIGN